MDLCHLIDESRERTVVRMVSYCSWVAKYYNSRVKPKALQDGEQVLRQAKISQSIEQEKLSLNWEDPYQVDEVVHPETYRLK